MAKNLKRNKLDVVTGVNDNDEVQVNTYLTPVFIPAEVWYEAIDVMDQLDELENENDRLPKEEQRPMAELMKDQIDLLIDMVVKIYGNAFSREDLKKGLHAPQMMDTLVSQVQFIAQGQQDEETKKYFEKKR